MCLQAGRTLAFLCQKYSKRRDLSRSIATAVRLAFGMENGYTVFVTIQRDKEGETYESNIHYEDHERQDAV